MPRNDVVLGVWAVLVGVTVASWALGAHHALGLDDEGASVLVLLLAFIKVRLVGQHFMELRGAPSWAARGLDAYCAVAFAGLTGVYLLA